MNEKWDCPGNVGTIGKYASPAEEMAIFSQVRLYVPTALSFWLPFALDNSQAMLYLAHFLSPVVQWFITKHPGMPGLAEMQHQIQLPTL